MNAWPEYVERLAGKETANAIAAKVGVDSSQISRWRNGKSIPTPGNAAKFAEAYGGDAGDALTAAGYLDAENYAEIVGALGLGGKESGAPVDPVATMSIPKLLIYIATVVDHNARTREICADRDLLEQSIEIDGLSTSMLLAALAGAERPVPDYLVETIEVLTRYIHGPGILADAVNVFGRMLRQEPGATEEAMRLVAERHPNMEGESHVMDDPQESGASGEADEAEKTSPGGDVDDIRARFAGFEKGGQGVENGSGLGGRPGERRGAVKHGDDAPPNVG